MKILIVGGAVRDHLMGVESSDTDYVVVGATEEEFLAAYPNAEKVGKAFPVYLVDGCEYAFARREMKTGSGHSDFAVSFGPEVTLKEDLIRRDLTINAMCMDGEEVIDPFGGIEDIKAGILRHVSAAFSEDPLRVFRVARFAATLGFHVAPDTISLMREISDSLVHLSSERVLMELSKALDGRYPRRFFDVLRDADALAYWFTPVHGLIGVEQPEEWHPEGDAYEHTMQVMERVSGARARFAALCHDLGKGITPEEVWPKHHNHDSAGIPLVREWCAKIRAPNSWSKLAEKVVRLHMQAKSVRKPGKIIRLAMEIGDHWEDFKQVVMADAMTSEASAGIAESVYGIETARRVLSELTGKDVAARWSQASGREFGRLLLQIRTERLRSELAHKL